MFCFNPLISREKNLNNLEICRSKINKFWLMIVSNTRNNFHSNTKSNWAPIRLFGLKHLPFPHQVKLGSNDIRFIRLLPHPSNVRLLIYIGLDFNISINKLSIEKLSRLKRGLKHTLIRIMNQLLANWTHIC